MINYFKGYDYQLQFLFPVCPVLWLRLCWFWGFLVFVFAFEKGVYTHIFKFTKHFLLSFLDLSLLEKPTELQLYKETYKRVFF